MVAYASRTGTRSNLDALRAHGWRLLVSATGVHRNEGFPYMLDNGAWTAFQKGVPFDSDLFCELLDSLGAGADFVVLPDIVEGGLRSLDMSLAWADFVRAYNPRIAIPVQDGMAPEHVADLLSPDVGVFVGGSTDFKLSTMPMWARLARSKGSFCHVGRVNSMSRIRLCALAGVHSFDGTNATIFSKNLPKLDRARRKWSSMFGWWSPQCGENEDALA